MEAEAAADASSLAFFAGGFLAAVVVEGEAVEAGDLAAEAFLDDEEAVTAPGCCDELLGDGPPDFESKS